METDSTQQIKNSRAALAQALHTKERARGNKPASDGTSNMSVASHFAALQALANGEPVPYPASLRIVMHEARPEVLRLRLCKIPTCISMVVLPLPHFDCATLRCSGFGP